MEPLRKLTREERIAARAARVAAKRNKDDGSTKNVTETGEPQRIISASKQHITGARQRVDQTKFSASRVVSSVKLARDASESERRRLAEQSRIERMNKLETELAEATKINQEIEQNWEQVAKKNIPQDLYQEIANQYKAASKLLASKDELIKMLQNDLKIKDEDYVELLAQHQEDIMTVVKRMHEQFHLFRECCEKELQQIEAVFIEERRELLEKNRAEIDSLFEKRRRMELQIMENAAARERQFASELAEIRSRDSEDYNALKVDLENSIQVLEQQLEEMRATYQLNSEKLEYNHSVLMERDQENKTTEEHHLQRLRRLKEALSAHIHRFHRQDAKYRQENAELTEEYKRITEQFKDLQKKYHHFETVDSRQYHQVWEMNEQRVMTLVHKVLKADQLITTQILGLKWAPPVAMQNGRLLDIDSITSTHVFNTPGPNDPVEHKTALSASSKLPDSPSAIAAGTTTVTVTPGATTATQPKGQFTNEQIKHVMDILSVECAFLLDSRVQDTLQTLTDDDEKQMYKVDTILSALGVEDREDVDELVAFFYDDPIHDKPSVHPNDVTRIVRDFVVKRQQSKAKPGTSGIHVKHTDSVTAEKKMRKKQRERLFWQKLGEVIPDSTYAVWTALEKAQIQYNTLLEERSQLITETTDLARQNEELKVLLQEYLGSKINEELQIPPTRLIRVDPR